MPYRIASMEGLMHGLYLLWWVQEKDVSPPVVAAILAAGDLALVGLELPTGWFADRFGHRLSLVAGSAVQIVGLLWCWVGDGVAGLVAASILIAVGDGFRSGADQALIYRTCRALDRESAFTRVEAAAKVAETGALVCLVLAGGFIVARWGFASGWIAEIVLAAVGLGLALAMAEPPHPPEAPASRDTGDGGLGILTLRMARVILPAAFVGGAAAASAFLAQTTGKSDPAAVAVLVAMMTAAEAAGAAMAAFVRRAAARAQIIFAAAALVIVIAATAVPELIRPGAIALAFLAGLAEPLRSGAIQLAATDGIRARAASAASAVDMAVMTVAVPLAAFWHGR